MKLLLHVCCAPCTIFPLAVLRQEGIEVQGYFVNPNIHPYQEFKKRLASVDTLARLMDFQVETVREYGLQEYLRQVVHQEDKRCGLCYEMRLRATALKARQAGVDAFSTTLLYSRYQKHELIRRTGERLAEQYAVPFYYQDFRVGWQEGIDMARQMDLYRQPYCGCIYSEQERYDKSLRKSIQNSGDRIQNTS